jgi:hypothetical protein
MAYFAQHAAGRWTPRPPSWPPSRTWLATWRPRLRSLLGTFLFRRRRPAAACSGGERQRWLARILMEPESHPADEPTHHLDLAGKGVLEDVARSVSGRVVVVATARHGAPRHAGGRVNDGRVVLPGRLRRLRVARRPGSWTRAPVAATMVEPRGAAGGAEPRTADAAAAAERSSSAPPGAPRTRCGASPEARPARPRETHARGHRGARVRRIERISSPARPACASSEGLLADPEIYHDGVRAKDLVTEYEAAVPSGRISVASPGELQQA